MLDNGRYYEHIPRKTFSNFTDSQFRVYKLIVAAFDSVATYEKGSGFINKSLNETITAEDCLEIRPFVQDRKFYDYPSFLYFLRSHLSVKQYPILLHWTFKLYKGVCDKDGKRFYFDRVDNPLFYPEGLKVLQSHWFCQQPEESDNHYLQRCKQAEKIAPRIGQRRAALLYLSGARNYIWALNAYLHKPRGVEEAGLYLAHIRREHLLDGEPWWKLCWVNNQRPSKQRAIRLKSRFVEKKRRLSPENLYKRKFAILQFLERRGVAPEDRKQYMLNWLEKVREKYRKEGV